MSVHRASAAAFDLDRIKQASAHRRRRERDAERVRAMKQLGAIALATCLPLAFLLFAEVPARRASARNDRLHAACARVYDAQACDCALSALAAANPVPVGLPEETLQVAAGTLPFGLRRADPPRAAGVTTRDFVQVVQACMAPSAQTPAD